MYSLHFVVRRVAISMIAALLTLPLASHSFAMTSVEAGFDLFQTQPGTSLNTDILAPPLPVSLGTIGFEGVPLETFDFGGTIGVQSVGNTDTIVERKTPATVATTPDAATIEIEIVALQLRSVAPVDLTPLGPTSGLPPQADLFVTLQSRRSAADTTQNPTPPPPTDSTGEMTIEFVDADGGTFSSLFELFFDIRLGALDGLILHSAHKEFQTSGVEWDRLPEPGDVLIDGINHFLAGLNDSSGDFFPQPLTEFNPVNDTDTIHKVRTATIPEPATSALFLAGLVGIGAIRRRGIKAVD